MFITSMSLFYQIFDKQSLNYPMLLNLHEVVMSVDWCIYIHCIKKCQDQYLLVLSVFEK